MHGRLSAAVAAAAARFEETEVIIECGDRKASCRDVLGLIALGAGCGARLIVNAAGRHKQRALAAVAEILIHEEDRLEGETARARLAYRRMFAAAKKHEYGNSYGRVLMEALAPTPQLQRIALPSAALSPRDGRVERLFKALDSSIAESCNKAALFLIGIDQKNDLNFVCVPFAAPRHISAEITDSPAPQTLHGPYSSHAWMMEGKAGDGGCESPRLSALKEDLGLRPLTPKNGSAGEKTWRLDRHVIADGESLLKRLFFHASACFRGTLSEFLESPAGFLRLDLPASCEDFLRFRFSRLEITAEEREALPELLSRQHAQLLDLLAQRVNPNKHLVKMRLPDAPGCGT